MSHQRSAAQHGVCLTRDQYTGTADLKIAVDCRCLSAQKRSLAVKKTNPPATLAKTRPDTPTTATTAVDCRCLSAQKRSLAVKKTDPPASLAKTRPDTPTTATTATTRKASRPLASPRQDLIPQLQQLQELQKLRVVRSLSYNIPFLNAVDCRCLSARKRSLAVKKTVPPASLAKTGPDTPTTATTATTRKAISGREKRRSRPLASPRQDLIPQLQQLQELQKLRVVRSLSYNIPFLNEVDSGAYRHRSDVKPLKKTVPPASLAKTRPDTPTTATTAATRTTTATTATTRSKKPFIHNIPFLKAVDARCLSAQKRSLAVKKDATTGTTATTRGGELRCLSAQKRSQAVKNTVPPASLAKTRPDTPTTGTTVTTATTRSRNLSYNVPFLKAVDSGAYLHRSDLRPHGEYVRIVSANNPARLDARRAIFVMSYMEHVPYACAASLGKQAVRVPEIRDAQLVAEKYTARSAALLSGCVHAGAAHPGHIRRGFRDGLHERSAKRRGRIGST
ncbi:hypothetical protein Bbelb_044670 [Branchiostoma belcheri]|nr:hypothetical protein Bbelb_044670 [Branchiostoma belcheri]